MDAMELHRYLTAWIVNRRNPSLELRDATDRMLNCLWAAAHNPTPPPTMAEDVAAFERAKAKADQN